MPFSQTVELVPVAPFDFDLTAQIFAGGDRQVRTYTNGVFHQVANLNGTLALLSMAANGSVERPKLDLTVKSNTPLSQNQVQCAQQTVKNIFNLDLDLKGFHQQIRKDPTMHKIAHQLCGLKTPTTPTVFEALVDSIIEQQISIKVARAIEERLAKKFGEPIEIDGETYFGFPTPKNIVDATVQEVQQVGLSGRKAQYIHGAAELIVEGKLDLEHLKNNGDSEQIIKELDAIKGIGVWTAELTMLRGMQRLDSLPADDFGIRRVISTYYNGGKPIKASEAREIAKQWGRWKGLAAYYLIVAEVRGVVV